MQQIIMKDAHALSFLLSHVGIDNSHLLFIFYFVVSIHSYFIYQHVNEHTSIYVLLNTFKET